MNLKLRKLPCPRLVFNYLIFKLHAFADKFEEARKDYGRHHALDIFYTVARMGEGDWQNAMDHYKRHGQKAYLKKACGIRQNFFDSQGQFGVIRLSENKAFSDNSASLSPFIGAYLKDMKDLFPY